MTTKRWPPATRMVMVHGRRIIKAWGWPLNSSHRQLLNGHGIRTKVTGHFKTVMVHGFRKIKALHKVNGPITDRSAFREHFLLKSIGKDVFTSINTIIMTKATRMAQCIAITQWYHICFYSKTSRILEKIWLRFILSTVVDVYIIGIFFFRQHLRGAKPTLHAGIW